MYDLHEAARVVEHYAALYGALALFFILFFESVGAPLPGESAVIASSLLAAHGDLSILHIIAATFAGGALGNAAGYVLGRYAGRSLLQRFGPRMGLSAERQTRLEAQFQQRGMLIVLTARFFIVLRQLNGVIAGTVAMPPAKFLIANVAGAALWASVWSLGPYFFSHLFEGKL